MMQTRSGVLPTSKSFSNRPLGASILPDGRVVFNVWAPQCREVEVELSGRAEAKHALEATASGYFQKTLDGIPAGTKYQFVLDGERKRPDPASRFQPEGVHGPSEIFDPAACRWSDQNFPGVSLDRYVLYELHVGTFTEEGTFAAVIPRLDDLKDLGITAVEFMPVAQFPGSRNWGYDGASPFAVQNSYGGPRELQRLVDACHSRGMAAVLDVVYNHLGPEGNYLAEFGPYFTNDYHTPWGQAINFDGANSDEVVRYFVENAIYWLRDFHFDALRLDAIHGIVDRSAQPFLQILSSAVEGLRRQTGRQIFLIAESDLNDSRVTLSHSAHGLGIDSQWSDDFHHSLHMRLTGERSGYYADFVDPECLPKAIQQGFVYDGQYSPSRRRRHGNSSAAMTGRQFVICAQNHDQIGNRMLGERLSNLIPFDALKVAAAVLLLAPAVPLLFMGEEYGELAPFQYFTSHSDPDLVEAVRKGRREEFSGFAWKGEPPDPQAESTFARSKLNWTLSGQSPHRELRMFYRELIRLRRTLPALQPLDKFATTANFVGHTDILIVRRSHAAQSLVAILNLSGATTEINFNAGTGDSTPLLDSYEERFGGPGRVTANASLTSPNGLALGPYQVMLFQSRETRDDG